ncbi:MAG: TolC family protein [Bacteroidetes bacterium]|nr:MAG: TolC family protein [Bacteroidota bacterium]
MKLNWILHLVLVIGCVTASGQEKLTLSQAVDIALKNNLGIIIAKNNVEANDILNTYGVAGGLPAINGALVDNQQVVDINQKYSDASRDAKTHGAKTNNLTANITGTIILFNGMKIISTKRQLDAQYLQSKEVLNSQVQNTIAAVMTSYYDIIRQQSYTGTISRSIEVSEKRLEILQTQFSVGMANNADIFQARLDLTALQQSLTSQQLIVDQAKTDLLTLLTLKPDSVIYVNDSIQVDNTIRLDSVFAQLDKNADIVAANYQIRINEMIARETAAQRYPTVRLNAGYNYSRVQNSAGFNLLNQSSGAIFGISLGVPIYNGGAYRREKQAADIYTENAEVQKRELVRDYSGGAVKTFQAYKSALAQLEVERKNYVVAQQLLDLVMQKYEVRQATIIDVREAQKSFEDAGYRLVNLEFSAKAAEIELKRVTNRLGL